MCIRPSRDLLLDPLIEDLVGIVSRELADRGLGMKAVHRGQDRSAGEKQAKRTESMRSLDAIFR
jgi:hypothetical protein